MVIYSKSLFSGSLIGATALIGMAGAAQAGLEICNDTSALQSVSVGYEASEGWTSEGWWNVDPGECKTVIGGDLKDRYYYLRAEVKAGEFEGDGFYFCTSPSEYLIVGDTDCEARDYDREDFIEIDAGEGAANYTYRMTDENTTAIQTAVARGLIFCNETEYEQSVSIGYEGAEGFTSEGWWNIPAGECKTPLGELEKEYYYFRAEVDGVSPAGDGHFFCTTREAFEIVGDQNCAARGYDSEDFREIFVGANKSVFTYTIDTVAADVGNAPPQAPKPDPAPVATADLVGLEICNQTKVTQSVSIGYEGDEGFTSEGWWNVEPDACSKVIGTALTKQYYYYRAEVDGGDFDGDNAIFCTTPKAYTIVGDQNCEARGYDSEDFAELNVGAGTTGYRHTIGGVADALSLLDKFPLPTETPVPTPVQTTAASGFRVCNDSSGRYSFSIGYEGAEDWTSEGWWNVDPGACTTLIAGDLPKQYYYLRAEQDAGDFDGDDFYFCTTPAAFVIVGDQNCEARGYSRESYIEIDIGAGTTGYIYRFTDAGNDRGLSAPDTAPDTGRGDVVETPVQEPVAVVDNISDAGAGLEFCNDTTATQSISVGYEGAEGWTSEGWWNVEPGACTTPALDGKNRRYFYYRAEVEGGEFDGQNYLFCTQPDAYTIVGDTGCAERGFDSEDFREIDTGGDTGLFTFTLVAAPSPEVVPAPGIDPNPPALTVIGGGVEFDRSGESVQEAPAVAPVTESVTEPVTAPVTAPTPDPAPVVVETPEPEPDPVVEPDPEPVPAVIPDPEPEPTGGGRRGGSRG